LLRRFHFKTAERELGGSRTYSKYIPKPEEVILPYGPEAGKIF
jgi:hypothetical protein